MDEGIRNFKDLKVWKKGIEIVKDVYFLAKHLPRDERFNLISQMKRSAISIPSNVAEGFKRFHNKEFKQFLYVSLGSAAELETQLIICQELNFVSHSDLEIILERLDHLSRMSKRLIRKLQ